MTIKGTKGNDTLKGTAKGDVFDLSLGGNDIANGLGGNDTFIFKGAFTAKDQIDGGAGTDVLSLAGDYSHGVRFGAKTIVDVETIKLGAHNDYKLTTNDANVAKNKALTVDGSKLGAGDTLTFNGSHETNGKFDLTGGKGNDVLTGGAKNDVFTLSHGGNDAANGSVGNDIFNLGAAFTATDKINGGAGSDVVNLAGGAAVTFGAKTMLGVEKIVLAKGHNYSLTTNDATVANRAVFTIDAHALAAANKLTFNGSHETNGTFHITGGAGADKVTMGYGANSHLTFNGGAGTDTLVLKAIPASGILSATLNGVTNVENVTFANPGTSVGVELTVTDSVIAAGKTLTIDATAVTVGVQIDGTAETNGGFHFTGGAGSDGLAIGSEAVLAASTYNGGAGTDNLYLDGNFAAQQTLSGISNIEIVTVSGGHNYNLVATDGLVGAGKTLTVDSDNLHAGDSLIFNGAAETDGFFNLEGGSGDDTFTIGNVAVLEGSTFDGGQGNDHINFVAQPADDAITLSIGDDTLSSVEQLSFANNQGFSVSWSVTTADGAIAAGNTLTVDDTNLDLTDSFSFDGSAETNGHFDFIISRAHNTLTGGHTADTFEIDATAGDSVLNTSTIDGGAGNDTIVVNGGGYSGFALAQVASIETLAVTGAHDYGFTIGDTSFSETAAMTIDATGLTGGHALSFDVSNLTGAKTITFNGGAGADSIAFGTGTIFENASVDGGDGNDTIYLNGDFSTATTISHNVTSVETIHLNDTGSYDLESSDTNVAAGRTMTVDGSSLTGTNALNFDGEAETDGNLIVMGGAGDDSITGGNLGDTLTGGAGSDTFIYTGAAQSQGTGYDAITDFNFNADKFDLGITVGHIDNVKNGSVDASDFNADMTALADPFDNAHDARIIHVIGLSLAGHDFLVVDLNGNGTYDSSGDLTIDITGHTGTLTTGDFI